MFWLVADNENQYKSLPFTFQKCCILLKKCSHGENPFWRSEQPMQDVSKNLKRRMLGGGDYCRIRFFENGCNGSWDLSTFCLFFFGTVRCLFCGTFGFFRLIPEEGCGLSFGLPGFLTWLLLQAVTSRAQPPFTYLEFCWFCAEHQKAFFFSKCLFTIQSLSSETKEGSWAWFFKILKTKGGVESNTTDAGIWELKMI